jgi:hypothetical protein
MEAQAPSTQAVVAVVGQMVELRQAVKAALEL